MVEVLPLALFPLPVRTSRSALAPKLIRRANGVAGVEGGAEPSPSSMTFSSKVGEPEREPVLDMLSRRVTPEPNGEVWVGDEPERPRVVMDIRRRFCAFAAAVAMEPGKAEVPLALAGDRPK